MKILIVSGYFKPNITPRAFRTTELAVELVNQGHDVVVYIPWSSYNYSDLEKELGIKILFFGTYNVENILHNKSKLSSKFFRVMNILFQYPKIKYINQICKDMKNESGYDLLISIGAPYSIHWGVNKLMKNNKNIASKWIADCGDPFMGSKVEFLPNPFWFKYFEKSFCRKADFITVPVKTAIDGYYPEFADKIRVIPQGFKMQEAPYNKNIINSVPTFIYAGMFYKGVRDPRPFLELLIKIKSDFLFILYTPKWNALDPYIEKLGNKIEIRELIPREKLLHVMSQMDFLVNFENGSIEQSPSKLIDYMIASRPVLSVSLTPKESDIISFLNGDYKNKLILKNLERFDIKNVAKQFISIK